MKNTTKKLVLLFTLTMVYFFISYDVIDMPFSYHPCYEHEWVNYQNKTTFHSKLFGDIPIANIGGRVYTINGFHHVADVAPVDGHMWIFYFIFWFKVLLIVTLLICLHIYTNLKFIKSECAKLFIGGTVLSYFFFVEQVSLRYGFSEVIIVILLTMNCMFTGSEQES